MTELTEGRLTFCFADHLSVTQYDQWSFYRNQFCGVCGGAKAVDFVSLDQNCAWLIEVKDYRAQRRTKVVDLGDEIALKVRDTLAGLVAAHCNANDRDEKKFAGRFVKKRKLKVVLHLEQPAKPSKLFPQVIDPSRLLMKLKQQIKSIDPHPVIVDQNSLRHGMDWIVRG